jgi:hypothetical protein
VWCWVDGWWVGEVGEKEEALAHLGLAACGLGPSGGSKRGVGRLGWVALRKERKVEVGVCGDVCISAYTHRHNQYHAPVEELEDGAVG